MYKVWEKVDDQSAFCIYCGSRLNPSAAGSAVSPGKPTGNKGGRAKIIIPIVLAIAVVLVGCVVGFKLYHSPSAEMNRAMKAGDMELAYEIFDDNFYAEDLSDKSIELLKTAAVQAQDDYLAGTITYEEATEILRYIRQFGSDEVSGTLSAAANSIETQYQIASQLETAEKYFQNGEYTSAITAFENVLSLEPSNADAASGLEKAENAYRDAVLEEAESYAARGDFDSAEDVIVMAVEHYFGVDAALADAFDSLQERKIEQMTEEVYAVADSGDWDGALALLDTYQEQYPDDQSLQDTRADIVKQMPITLKNLTTVSSKSVTVLTSAVRDRWGNVYDGAARYNASTDAFALYNLNKEYISVSGIVFVPTEASNGKNMSFAIYLDEELVYYQDGITEESAPISFEIAVTGATTMRIVTDNVSSYSSGFLYFANTHFEKYGYDAGTEVPDTMAETAKGDTNESSISNNALNGEARTFTKSVDGSLNLRTLPQHDSQLEGTIDDDTILYFYGEIGQGLGSDGLMHD